MARETLFSHCEGCMKFPEYSVSLLIWILPILALTLFFIKNRLLSPEKSFAMLITVAVLASVGITLDLVFAKSFFVFPNPKAILGIAVMKIPIEEFVFYITGFWFVLFVYVFCDEWYLKKYNLPDLTYARFRSKIKRKFFLHLKSVWWGLLVIAAGIVIKRALNPEGWFVPGYFIFLVVFAYVPTVLFYRITKSFVNWRAYFFSLIVTVLISIVWEVTLALPRGYWGFQKGAMLGIFIDVWNGLPIEEITIWIFCTFVILLYEFLKICYFTAVPTVPGHKLLLKIGRDWRKQN
jgi:lycopene cyclase domain-containing protein